MKNSAPTKYAPPLVIDAARYISYAAGKILWRVKYHGRKNIPKNLKSGLLIVANHQTYFDPFWICAPIKRKFRFMAWDKAFDWFFIGWLIKYLGSFPVDTTRGTTKSVLRESFSTLKDGATLLIFPEGARSFPDGKLLEFKTGAIRIAMEAGVPVLPVTVKGANRVWSQTMKRPHFSKVEIFYHPLFHVPRPPDKEDMREHLEKLTAQIVEIIKAPL
ncbi:MAG TPA: lysophospholipid acyltransferase family protein [Pyrinomonadaceae bacterium]|nr:lysophospholipid acyltransferase family protein [Pyrinomonadaceae bacterium]